VVAKENGAEGIAECFAKGEIIKIIKNAQESICRDTHNPTV